MEYCGIHHRKIMPLWPRANAQAENFIKPLNKAIKTATVEGKSWRQELYKFLRNYRGTNIKVLLPKLSVKVNDEVVRIRDADQKAKQKRNADAKSVKPISQLHVGDTVLVRQPKVNKLSTSYHPTPLL